MHPQCPTESHWPGTDSCVCHSQWLRIRGASGSAWLNWPGTNLGTSERAQLGAWGVELGCQKHCGHVARSQPHLQASEGIPPLPGHGRGSTHHSAATAAAGTWLERGAACWPHLVGHPLANSLPKSAGAFQHRCSPPPPVAPENWFPAGSSDRLPKDGSSKPGMAGEEREGCNTLSILPSAEYCLGKTMRPFFKCNLREILALPAAPATPCPPALASPAPLLAPTAPA